jgi:hypothetical protein
LGRSVTSVTAGLGLGLVTVIAISVFSLRLVAPRGVQRRQFDIYSLLCLASWVALLAFMAKVGAYQNARYLASYYPLLLLPLLWRPELDAMVRRGWWQKIVLAVMLATLAFMSFEYGREFVPSSVFARLQSWSNRPGFLKILDDYYRSRISVAARRSFTTRYSADKTVVGYATIYGGLEPGMWQPLGHGRVERVLPNDSPDSVRSRGIQYVFIEDSAMRGKNETIQQWLDEFNATIVDQMTFMTDPGAPVAHLYFCSLNPVK